MLQREYDDDAIDPNNGQQQKEEEPEAMDLPDDLNLDDIELEDGEDKPQGEQGTLTLNTWSARPVWIRVRVPDVPYRTRLDTGCLTHPLCAKPI